MRSLEVFRELGLADAVRDPARDLAAHDHMAAGRTLAEAEQLPLWRPAPADEPFPEVSPELPCLVAQDVLEPVLRRAAEDAGADVRFGTALTAFDQDDDAVVADLRDHRGDVDGQIHASYLVAADGARSPVRVALGIARSGRGAIGDPSVNVYFQADLADVVRGRASSTCAGSSIPMHPARSPPWTGSPAGSS